MTPAAMRKTLEQQVDQLIDRSSFFNRWKPGVIEPETSKKFLASFDSLVKTFPSLIAAGASRATNETTRSVLAVNLYQECGEGDITRTHHAIYRKYLMTAGIALDQLVENPFAAQWRTRLFDYVTKNENPGAVLGALAAGEFLAQPALSRIYKVLEPQFPQADQEYFTKHLVLEEEHVQEITTLLSLEAKDEAGWAQVVEGFRFGLAAWETYFDRLADHITTN